MSDVHRSARQAAEAVATTGPAGESADGPGFAAALREAASIAALGPSSHNCQPWAYARPVDPASRRAAAHRLGGVDGDDREYVALALDRDRRLDALPAHAVEMLLSCGLFWGILCRALAAQGWVVDAVRFTDIQDADSATLGASWPPTWSPLLVAGFRHAGAGAAFDDLAELRATATARRTNRAPYRDTRVDPEVLRELAAPGGASAAGGSRDDNAVTIRHLRTAGERARFADFVARYGGRDFSHAGSWRETHSYLRRSDADARARGDGFTLEQLFGPMSWPRRRLMHVALAPATMRALCRVGYHRFLARQLAAAVRPTPVIVAMCFRDDTPSLADTVRAGARLADYWLHATRSGLVLHPISVVLQHDDLRADLRRRFHLAGRPFFVSRLGRPAADFPAPPRRFDDIGRTM